MRQTKKQELSPDLRARLVDAQERFPKGWKDGKTLDAMVAETSAVALEVASSLVQARLLVIGSFLWRLSLNR